MRFGLALMSLVLIGIGLSADDNDYLARLFKSLDTNGDGKLSAKELEAHPLLSGKLGEIDADGDGCISLDELRVAARMFRNEIPKPSSSPTGKSEIRRGPKFLKPTEMGVGRMIADFAVTDLDGKSVKLSEIAGENGTVIAFTSVSCPISKKYAPSLLRMEKECRERKIGFLFVDPTSSDNPAELRKTFPGSRVVHEKDAKLTSILDARSTAEVFLLDAKRTLVYRGALDDQYGQGYSLDQPRETYLKDAIENLTTHQPIRIRATEAPGCALESISEKRTASASTYHNRISRIVQECCVECHRDGGLAPFSLEKAEDLTSRGAMICKVVENGTMPPWFAAPPEKGQVTPWANDRSMTATDKSDLIAWLKSDCPLGDSKDAPIPREFPKDWAIGKPDLILQLPHEVKVKAEGIMNYQNLIVETELTEDKWIEALEVKPTAKQVVHHVLVFVLPPGVRAKGEERPGGEARDGFFAAYVPGNSTFIYPPGLAKKLPKGTRLRFQMHYTPNGTATVDRTQLGLVFAKEPPKHEVRVYGLVNTVLEIPPGADNHSEAAFSPKLPFDVKILSFMPHMHVRGKAFRYEATTPDKVKRTLLDVPAYDFNWQLVYRFADPVSLPRGSTIKATGWFDNSKANPANPDPTKTVKWGPQTFDEMLLGYVEYYVE